MSTILWNNSGNLVLTVTSEEDEVEVIKSRIEEVHGWTFLGIDIWQSDGIWGHEIYDWDNGLVANLNKAKEVVKLRIRGERAARLAELDIEFMRNLEQGINTGDIVNEKQRLRDLPEFIDSLTSIDELALVKV